MKPSDNLYSLIRSLNSSEKIYIKKYAGIYSKSKHNYHKLLDAIKKQEVYDEKALLIKFRKESFVKHFAVTKNQLFELILKLLRQFHHENSIHTRINATIENSRMLYDRGLNSAAFKQLDKAYKLAEEHAEYLKMQEIVDLKCHYIGQLKAHDWRTDLDDLLLKKEMLSKGEVERVAYSKIYYQLLFLVRKYNQLRSQEQQDLLESILPNGNFSPQQQSYHIYNQLLVLNIKSIYYFLTKNFDKATESVTEVLNLWDKHPKIRQNNLDNYIEAINNYMNLGVVNKDMSTFEYVFAKIKNVDQSSFRTQVMVFQHEIIWRISYYQLEKRYDDLFELIPQIEQSLDRFKTNIDDGRYFIITHIIALIYFNCGNYNKAIEHLTVALELKHISLRSNFQMFVNMTLFFAHYSLGNLIFLNNALKNYQRKIKKKGLLYDFENFQLRMLLKLCAAKNKTETQELLDLFQNELTDLLKKKPDLNTSLYGYINLWAWINATKQNCTMKTFLEQNPNSWERDY